QLQLPHPVRSFFPYTTLFRSRGRGEVHDLELGRALTEPHLEADALPERLIALGRGASREPLGHATRIGQQGEDPLDRHGDGLDDGSADRAHEGLDGAW